jgi:alkylation response protein AidB-like acyl-CoA dehydrogenase
MKPMEAAAWLDGALGDPRDAATVFNYAKCADFDDVDGFPEDIVAQLNEIGVQRYYVPARHGGLLTEFETGMQMMRMVARRDITVAVAHGKTFLGGVSVWVGGDEDQARRLGKMITDGTAVSWGLTERDHGSDLLHGEVRAVPIEDAIDEAGHPSYRLTGEKWLINNATRGGAVCVLARTDEAGGPRGFSLFLVDKAGLAEDDREHLPKVFTHGIRGADISGFALRDAVVEPNTLVGKAGVGVEIVLKGLQLTRTVCAALSLGGADHALSSATRFALSRQLYGRQLADLPAAKYTLATAYADHLLVEAMAVVAARAINGLTGEMSVLSAAVKYFVPTRVEAMMVPLRKLVGARSLLRDVYEPGGLAKVERDHRIVSLFDGNTLVNLHALVNHFPGLLRANERGTEPDTEGLRTTTTLSETLPEWRPETLSLLPRKGSSLLLSLRSSAADVAELAESEPGFAQLAELAAKLVAALDLLYQRMASITASPMDVPKSTFVLAGHLASCIAGSAALRLWLDNRVAFSAESPDTPPALTALWRDGIWPAAALSRVLWSMGDTTCRHTPRHQALFDALVSQVDGNYLPSLLACRLVEGGGQPSWSTPF